MSKPEIDEASPLSQDEQNANMAQITKLNEEKWQSYEPIADMKTYRINHQGVDMDVIPWDEYKTYKHDLTRYIDKHEGYWTNSTKKGNVLLLKKSSAERYLRDPNPPRYLLSISHRSVIDEDEVKDKMRDIDAIAAEVIRKEAARKAAAEAATEAAAKQARREAKRKKEEADKKAADEAAAKAAAEQKQKDEDDQKEQDRLQREADREG